MGTDCTNSTDLLMSAMHATSESFAMSVPVVIATFRSKSQCGVEIEWRQISHTGAPNTMRRADGASRRVLSGPAKCCTRARPLGGIELIRREAQVLAPRPAARQLMGPTRSGAPFRASFSAALSGSSPT